MKNMKKILILVVLFSGFVASSFAQGTGTTATSAATIIAPISIGSSVGLAFGNIAVNNTVGTVELPADLATAADRVAGGGVTLPATTGTVTAATFTVTGQATSTFTIGLPPNGSVIISGTGFDMTLNDFTSTLPNEIGTIGGGGSVNFYVGATLSVGASQLAGGYSGTFPVTVNYN